MQRQNIKQTSSWIAGILNVHKQKYKIKVKNVQFILHTKIFMSTISSIALLWVSDAKNGISVFWFVRSSSFFKGSKHFRVWRIFKWCCPSLNCWQRQKLISEFYGEYFRAPLYLKHWVIQKLDGVSPVDRRPFPMQLHQ